ncbi:MAG TPA: outer membrane beta-barrel protein [Gallionella sp.]|nr:outer membrane beta-barrel protein [Gallionella sp.]
MKKLIKTAGALGLVGCVVMSSAFAADDTFWYMGGNIGQSKAKIDDARITGSLSGAGLPSSISDDNKGNAFKLFGGYQFNRNFALEGGYFNLGEFGYTATTVPPALAGTLNGKIKLQGLNLDAVGMLPLGDKFSVFGRLGLQYAQAKDTFTSTGAIATPTNPSPSKNALNYKAGVGAQYDFNRSLGMRVEAERYRINDAINNKGDIDMYSIGLVYRFDQNKPAPVEKVVMPEREIVIVHTPPPPAPPAEIVYVTKVVFSVDSGTDALFGFGKSGIKPTGKRALDKFAANLKGAHYRTITVTGNTDRIGSHAANMKLSLRRADAVKDYLVASAGIPADKISARGAGESNPLTKPGECKGHKVTKKLVACLAPDRRVEVDVTGTRPAK